METISNDALIATFTKILIGKQVDTEAILKALQYICHYFNFEGGLIYEIDQYNEFHLKERFPKHINKCDKFSFNQVKDDYYHLLFENELFFKANAKSDILVEQECCQVLEVSNLILYPIFDHSQQMLAFICFFNETNTTYNSHYEDNTLYTILNILDRYIGKRVYENKTSFVKTSLESILDNTGIDIYVNDFYSHDILYVNKSMAAPYGGVEQFKDKKCWQVLFPGQSGSCEFCPQKKIVDETGTPTKIYTWDYQRPFDGSWFRVFSAAFRWLDGRLAHVVSSADITDNKKYEALINHMANYDSLTDLPNRRMLIKDCENRIKNATEKEMGYILFFDIDGFKAINDQYGHHSGDEFLIQLANFLNQIPLLKNSIYRNGGDEFVGVISGENMTKSNIQNLCYFIHERFKKPWQLEAGDVYCNCSIGIACYPEDGATAEGLLHIADLAMYKAKKQGGARICFSYELHQN